MNCNFNVRRDKSFADDLVVATGRVPSRVALSLRASERQPARPWFVGGVIKNIFNVYNLVVVPPLLTNSRHLKKDVCKNCVYALFVCVSVCVCVFTGFKIFVGDFNLFCIPIYALPHL
jgi:hypothetical protein